MTFHRLLIPTDFSEPSAEPLRYALRLAAHFDAELHLLHVAAETDDRASAERDLAAFAEAHAASDATRAVVTAGAAAPGIRAYADEHAIDLILMSSHGRRGLERLFLGSVTEEVLRDVACPVLTVRTGLAAPAEHRVLAPLDLSDSSLEALPYARTFAAVFDTPVDLLHVVEDVDIPAIYGEDITSPLFEQFPEAQERTRDEIERVFAAASGPEVPSAVHFSHGHSSEAIVDFAEAHRSGLIVMTRTGRRGLTRLVLGSTTDGVLRTAPCPVLVVPSEA